MRILNGLSTPDTGREWGILAGRVILAAALPVFLISVAVTLIINSSWLYQYNWWRNDIPDRTGLPREQLQRGADQIVDYFNNDEEFLDLRVTVNGREVSLYNQREVLHMVDVKGLVQGVYAAGIWTGAVALAISTVGLWHFRSRFWGVLRDTVRWSAIGTLAFIAVLGIASAISFRAVFILFHLISFDNDLWQLDPRTDYLLIMFPQQFFFEATVMIAMLTVMGFGALYLASSLMARRYTFGRAEWQAVGAATRAASSPLPAPDVSGAGRGDTKEPPTLPPRFAPTGRRALRPQRRRMWRL